MTTYNNLYGEAYLKAVIGEPVMGVVTGKSTGWSVEVKKAQ